MKIPKIFRENLLLKMTSLNAVVIGVRLLISLFVQRLLAQLVGEVGISKIGSLRNLLEILGSFASLGAFSGIVKYVSEFKEDKEQLQKLFSTTFVFTVLSSIVIFIVLFFGAGYFNDRYFPNDNFIYLFKLLAVLVPFISINRIFNAVVNGLSRYKKLAGIDLLSYILSTILTVILLLTHNIDGALIAIAVAPAIQLVVLLFIFYKVLKEYIEFSKLSFNIPMWRELLAFSVMSFFATVLLNYVELDIRRMITNRISENEAGVWTALTYISKNYMVFSSAMFSLYVLPKFAGIHTKNEFKSELFNIYKTLLPLFGVGMILVYVFRDLIIQIIYPDFHGMSVLFKWQLLGDFIRLAAMVLGYQFLAKKMVRNFIFSEVVSSGMFYFLSYYFIDDYGVEGVVIAHFIRYIITFAVILFLVMRHFKKQKNTFQQING